MRSETRYAEIPSIFSAVIYAWDQKSAIILVWYTKGHSFIQNTPRFWFRQYHYSVQKYCDCIVIVDLHII